MKCPKCFNSFRGYNTGEIGQNGFLDCADCTTAAERVVFNGAMGSSGAIEGMIRQDEQWHAYQLGHAAAVAELLPLLRAMWGHAIELAESNYFDDPEANKDDWQRDLNNASALLAKYRKN